MINLQQRSLLLFLFLIGYLLVATPTPYRLPQLFSAVFTSTWSTGTDSCTRHYPFFMETEDSLLCFQDLIMRQLNLIHTLVLLTSFNIGFLTEPRSPNAMSSCLLTKICCAYPMSHAPSISLYCLKHLECCNYLYPSLLTVNLSSRKLERSCAFLENNAWRYCRPPF
jgi:hypothetical protein